MVQVAPETLADVARQVLARRVVATLIDVMVFFRHGRYPDFVLRDRHNGAREVASRASEQLVWYRR
jgi:hypothetical protein